MVPDKTQGQPYMLIRELQRHFPARLPEWANAATMLCWGAYILLHPGIFATNSMYDAFVSMAWMSEAGIARTAVAENLWGLVTVWVGTIRLFALFVNGSYSRTPMIRLLTSAASAFIWTQLVIGIWNFGAPSTGLVMYSSAVCLDLISAYRAGCDVAMAELTRRGNAGAEKRGKFGEYSPAGAL